MRLEEVWHPRALETVLGPSRGRFFGEGYRGVHHELRLSPSATRNGDTRWLARVTYPTGWSQDDEGKSREPHLSTVDAVVLPLMALSSLGGRGDGATSYEGAYVSRIDLRAGNAPWLDLDSVPLSLHKEEAEASMRGRVLEKYRATAGNLHASMSILDDSLRERPPRSPRDRAAADARGVYDDLYRSTRAVSFSV